MRVEDRLVSGCSRPSPRNTLVGKTIFKKSRVNHRRSLNYWQQHASEPLAINSVGISHILRQLPFLPYQAT